MVANRLRLFKCPRVIIYGKSAPGSSQTNRVLLRFKVIPSARSVPAAVHIISRWQTFTIRPGVIITSIRIYHLLSINKFRPEMAVVSLPKFNSVQIRTDMAINISIIQRIDARALIMANN